MSLPPSWICNYCNVELSDTEAKCDCPEVPRRPMSSTLEDKLRRLLDLSDLSEDELPVTEGMRLLRAAAALGAAEYKAHAEEEFQRAEFWVAENARLRERLAEMDAANAKGFTAGVVSGERSGAAAERARIVEWLRSGATSFAPDSVTRGVLDVASRLIEGGAAHHLRNATKGNDE